MRCFPASVPVCSPASAMGAARRESTKTCLHQNAWHRQSKVMHFRDLNESQILALAITAEEEDARIYRDFAESLRADFPATAELFTRMAGEEDRHRHRLIEIFRQRFGEHIPLIRRQDVKGFSMRRRPSWFTGALGPARAREEAALMEIEARHFY